MHGVNNKVYQERRAPRSAQFFVLLHPVRPAPLSAKRESTALEGTFSSVGIDGFSDRWTSVWGMICEVFQLENARGAIFL